MNKMIATAALAALTLAATLPALAKDDHACGNAPRASWMSQDAVKAKAIADGYQVRRVKIENDCYEVYAIGKDGAKVELIVNPVSGDIVKTQTAD